MQDEQNDTQIPSRNGEFCSTRGILSISSSFVFKNGILSTNPDKLQMNPFLELKKLKEENQVQKTELQSLGKKIKKLKTTLKEKTEFINIENSKTKNFILRLLKRNLNPFIPYVIWNGFGIYQGRDISFQSYQLLVSGLQKYVFPDTVKNVPCGISKKYIHIVSTAEEFSALFDVDVASMKKLKNGEKKVFLLLPLLLMFRSGVGGGKLYVGMKKRVVRKNNPQKPVALVKRERKPKQ